MALTPTQRGVYEYCNNIDFIPPDKIKEFEQRLTAEGNLSTLSFALEKFTNGTCPKCNSSGAFKWHFLGKLTHPVCSRSWYVSPGTYMVKSIKDIFRTGVDVGGATGFEENKKGESGGFIGFIFGFIFGIAFRAPFVALMVPIQTVVSISQKKQ